MLELDIDLSWWRHQSKWHRYIKKEKNTERYMP